MRKSVLNDALDVETLAVFLKQFGDAGAHLLTAGAEIVMALKAFLDRLLELVEDDPQLRARLEFLYLAQGGLGILSSQLGKTTLRADAERDKQHEAQAKLRALQSILAVIESEIAVVAAEAKKSGPRGQSNPALAVRLGAFEAVRNVLLEELGKGPGAPSGTGKSKKRPPSRKPKASRSTVK